MAISILAGFLGMDRFYDGQVLWGVLKMVTLGGVGVWYLADAAYYTHLAGKGHRHHPKEAEARQWPLG